MSKKVVLTMDDEFYQDFKRVYGRPGKAMTQIILDKMYELLDSSVYNSRKFYEHVDECLQEVDCGGVTELGLCSNGAELLNKLSSKK